MEVVVVRRSRGRVTQNTIVAAKPKDVPFKHQGQKAEDRPAHLRLVGISKLEGHALADLVFKK